MRDEPARSAPELVDRQFTAAGLDRRLVADITDVPDVPTWAGFLYFAVVLDAWSSRVIGWAMETHLRTELREDFHRIVYAVSGESARAAYTACARKWSTRCPGVARSLAEGGDELLTFFRFPKAQWKTLRTTNAIERLNEGFRRRVKTQGSLPTEDAAVSLLFGLVASGQIRLRKIDGHTKLATVIRERMTPAA